MTEPDAPETGIDRRFAAAAVGTLILCIGMWFGLLTVRTAPVMAVTIIGLAMIFAMYAVAGFAGVDNIGNTAFKGAMFALVCGIGLLVAHRLTGNASFALIAPVTASGVGGSVVLTPLGDRGRSTARQVGVLIAAFAIAYVFRVDEVLYAIFTPLVPFPVIMISDRLYDRGKGVVGEALDD